MAFRELKTRRFKEHFKLFKAYANFLTGFQTYAKGSPRALQGGRFVT